MTRPRRSLCPARALHGVLFACSLLILATASHALAQLPASAEPPPPPKPFAQGYLYVELYQARFECLIDLPTALDWLGVPDSGGAAIPATEADALLPKAAALAAAWCSARVDGVLAQPTLTLTQFVGGEPGRTLPLPPGESITPRQTMLGFMWEFPTGPQPQSIQILWKGFIKTIETMPVAVFFGGESESHVVSNAIPSFVWNNNNRVPPPKPLAIVPPLPQLQTFPLPLGGCLWFTGGLAFYLLHQRKRRRPQKAVVRYLTIWLLGTLLTSPLLVLRLPRPGNATTPAVEDVQAAEAIVAPLLRNIYRAFDHRTESTIYDVLARSADGPLLKSLYLDILGALSLDSSESARVHVAEFAAEVEQVTPAPTGSGFVAQSSWTALGSVGHWGHSHTRTNVCQANVTIEPVNGSWKITAIEMLDQRRL